MTSPSKNAATATRAATKLAQACQRLPYPPPVATAYHPLAYAWRAHQRYITRYLPADCHTLFIGMNPGPYGMAQTGIPFGDIASVRDYLDIAAPIDQPPHPHPKRPVQGFACTRREISGSRLWNFFAERYGAAPQFFRHHFVTNYCPVLFLQASGANLTPDKLPKSVTAPLYAHCDDHLKTLIAALNPTYLIGIGTFAEQRLKTLYPAPRPAGAPTIGKILHPSPASPQANKSFTATATRQLDAIMRPQSSAA